QNRATIAKSSSLPHDSPPMVTSPAAIEGNMQQTINKLTALCTSLQRQFLELAVKFEAQEIEITRLKARVKHLEDRKGKKKRKISHGRVRNFKETESSRADRCPSFQRIGRATGDRGSDKVCTDS
nr:hypothetical protein [Tanacetum cinerariifolium]